MHQTGAFWCPCRNDFSFNHFNMPAMLSVIRFCCAVFFAPFNFVVKLFATLVPDRFPALPEPVVCRNEPQDKLAYHFANAQNSNINNPNHHSRQKGQ